MSGTVDIVVWVRTSVPGRVEEACRAGVGLGLRGARVALIATEPLDHGSALVARADRTLRALGHQVEAPCTPARALEVCRSAKAVEIWT